MSSPDFEGHIPRLRDLASECDSAVEFGIRHGDGSTLALVQGIQKKLRSYDIRVFPLPEIWAIANERGIDFKTIEADVRKIPPVEPCDLLFIDTDHWYGQLRDELALHAGSARKYIVLHDTVTSWKEDLGRPGLGGAVEEFLAANPNWFISAHYLDWNGLMVLENRDALALSDISEA